MLAAEKVRAVLEELAPAQEKVDRAVKTAIEVTQPSRVILFGSWPRGEAKWDSDLVETVRLIREHVVTRIAALSATS
jgi:predicted nucleotidyltransferase